MNPDKFIVKPKSEEPKENQIDGPSSNIKEYREMFDKQAEAKNAYRKWYQKLLGDGKIESTDIINERVGKYDQALDLELSSGNSKSIAEAIDKIEERDEFKLKSSEKIEQEEFSKRKLFIVADSLDKNNFSLTSEKASALLSKIESSKNIDDVTKEGFKQKLDQLVTGKANDLLLGKEYENFVSIIEQLSSIKKFTAEDFKNISPEIMKSGELIEVVKKNIVNNASYGANSFIRARDQWDTIGIISKEGAGSMPEVVEAAKKELKNNLHYYGSFVKVRDQWVDTGVITVEEANKIWEEKEKGGSPT